MKNEIKSYEYFIQTAKKDIDYINKIIEAYEGLGIVRTIDPKAGTIKIISLECYKDEIHRILNSLKNDGVEIEITEECIWRGII